MDSGGEDVAETPRVCSKMGAIKEHTVATAQGEKSKEKAFETRTAV